MIWMCKGDALSGGSSRTHMLTVRQLGVWVMLRERKGY